MRADFIFRTVLIHMHAFIELIMGLGSAQAPQILSHLLCIIMAQVKKSWSMYGNLTHDTILIFFPIIMFVGLTGVYIVVLSSHIGYN